MLLHAALLALSVSLAGCGHEPKPEGGETARGELAAAAMREVLGGVERGDARIELMQSREVNIPRRVEPWNDGYSSWLAAWLVRRAADGTLFVEDNGTPALHMTWIGGDSAFWYIGRVSRLSNDGVSDAAGGPWVFWENLNLMITPSPDGSVDRSFREIFELDGVSEGDIVELDVYRLSKVTVSRSDLGRLDLSDAISDGSAKQILRLPLPVIIRSGDPPSTDP
ncbi:MAG: hypothetical protein JJU33_11760 [Phycisphaerales bacterium]|nr:hypothetical protein [Phycisphaerales bacterium]